MFRYIYFILLGYIYCITCGPGEFINNGKCEICTPGTYSPIGEDSATRCEPCEFGTFSENKAVNCSLCPSGSYSPHKCVDGCLIDVNIQSSEAIVGDCQPCTYESQCEECPIGYFSDILGCRGICCCLPCPLGHFCPNKGATHPLECPINTYTDKWNQKECITCGFLQVSNEGSSKCFFSNQFFIFLAVFMVLIIFSLVCLLNSQVQSTDAIEIEKMSFLWKKHPQTLSSSRVDNNIQGDFLIENYRGNFEAEESSVYSFVSL
eukprot:TRINITY_DN9445_c0_g1_i1.p1 TRINITY_DN9445_c0_g1~~TRINITY_DN9445_c0_g1_i1.p1  ORF type:complete len:263 (-),score=49.31 TRINITY_DN9445_c0_g1_i1:181-969(-)